MSWAWGIGHKQYGRLIGPYGDGRQPPPIPLTECRTGLGLV